jgi:DNA-binding transcriptional regulator YdaS (Cro superfamily)
MLAMKLNEYLQLKKQKPYQFCLEHGFNKAMIYDYLRGRRKLMLGSAMAISAATQGAVRVEELNGSNQ